MNIQYTMSLRWSSYVSPKEGGSKTQNGRFSSTIALRWKEVCYKVSLCENCQQQNCRAFIGLSIGAKMIGEGRLLLRENLANTDTAPPCSYYTGLNKYSCNAAILSGNGRKAIVGRYKYRSDLIQIQCKFLLESGLLGYWKLSPLPKPRNFPCVIYRIILYV